MAGKSYSELNFGNFATANNSDQQFAIYLTKDETPAKTQQNAQLIIRDVTPDQEQDLGSYTQPGLEGDAISFGSAQEFVQNLLNKGYVWDGASYNGPRAQNSRRKIRRPQKTLCSKNGVRPHSVEVSFFGAVCFRFLRLAYPLDLNGSKGR